MRNLPELLVPPDNIVEKTGADFEPNFKLNKMVRNLPELLVPPDNILVAAATLFLQLSQVTQVLAALATCNVIGNRQ